MMEDYPGAEDQSKFNAGLELAKDIHSTIRMANMSSHFLTSDGLRMWWLYLQDVERMIQPRLKQKEHRELLDKSRVQSVPQFSRKNELQGVLVMRNHLNNYQRTLEFLRDKLGLGFKPGDDPGQAILK